MSDTYNYEEGAIHNDNKRVVHIESINGSDARQLLRDFLKMDAEEADFTEEEAGTAVSPAAGDNVAEKLRSSILLLKEEKVLKNKYDWGFVMVAMMQTDDLPSFKSVQSFIDYLTKTLHIDDIPSESTVNKKVGIIKGQFPHWSFDDTDDSLEVNRRINVGKRLLAAFRKQK